MATRNWINMTESAKFKVLRFRIFPILNTAIKNYDRLKHELPHSLPLLSTPYPFLTFLFFSTTDLLEPAPQHLTCLVETITCYVQHDNLPVKMRKNNYACRHCFLRAGTNLYSIKANTTPIKNITSTLPHLS